MEPCFSMRVVLTWIVNLVNSDSRPSRKMGFNRGIREPMQEALFVILFMCTCHPGFRDCGTLEHSMVSGTGLAVQTLGQGLKA